MGFTKRAIGVMIQCLRNYMFIAMLSFLNVFPTSLYLPLLHAQVSKDELVHVDPFPEAVDSEQSQRRYPLRTRTPCIKLLDFAKTHLIALFLHLFTLSLSLSHTRKHVLILIGQIPYKTS